jgi:hypothetical protein
MAARVPPPVPAHDDQLARIERIRALYEDTDTPVREIAHLVARHESVIYRHAERRGWKRRGRRHGPKLSIDEIRALYEQSGVPVSEIGRLARLSERAIYRHAARGGWKPRARDTSRAGASDHTDLAAAVAAARRRAAAKAERAARRAALAEIRQLTRVGMQMARAAGRDDRASGPPPAAARSEEEIERSILAKLEAFQAEQEQPPRGGARPARRPGDDEGGGNQPPHGPAGPGTFRPACD